ncbi:hypothetical protein ZWY2020_010389 [Hordeum vulgare]|nr:hypothetical protein ZWY2020_010389 [Hordeum vulgare]
MAVVLGAFVPDTGAVAQRRRRGGGAGAKRRSGREEAGGEAGSVAAVLGDAEAQAAGGDEATARWLAEVRAAAYEADGAVDRCRVAARRLGAGNPSIRRSSSRRDCYL